MRCSHSSALSGFSSWPLRVLITFCRRTNTHAQTHKGTGAHTYANRTNSHKRSRSGTCGDKNEIKGDNDISWNDLLVREAPPPPPPPLPSVSLQSQLLKWWKAATPVWERLEWGVKLRRVCYRTPRTYAQIFTEHTHTYTPIAGTCERNELFLHNYLCNSGRYTCPDFYSLILIINK